MVAKPRRHKRGANAKVTMSESKGNPQPVKEKPTPEVVEDSSTQALSEALRSSFAVIKYVMILLVLVFLFSGWFQVGTQERAMVLRLGKPAGGADAKLLGPGLHWAFPYPVDEVVKIPMGQAQTVSSSVGWYATTVVAEAGNAEPPPPPTLNPAAEGYVLTGDANIIHVRGTLVYRLTEPAIRYAFDFVNASNVVQNIFDNAINYAAANYAVDNALTRDIAGFREKVRMRIEQLAASYNLGITVDQVSLQTIPPRQLTGAFAAVLDAEVRSSKLRNDALSYENQTVSRANSQAAVIKNEGEAYKKRLLETVAAEAKNFEDLLPSYLANPEVFVKQRQLQTLQRIYASAQKKWLSGSAGQIRLQLNNEQKPFKAPTPVADDHH